MYLTVKRFLDAVAAFVLLVLLSPVMLVIAVGVRLKLGSPVLFRQVRPGFHEDPFTCLKFRTMSDERGADGRLLSDDKRLTSLGLFLRRTSLDELPQLWNILKGELSFIGPRALLMQYLPVYTAEEHRRHSVRPGLSGWAQVQGRNFLPFDERLALDVWYVDHFSFRLDAKILLLTFWVVLTQHGFSSRTELSLDELRSKTRADINPVRLSGSN